MKNKILLPLFVVLGILFSMSFVLGAITFVNPSSAGETENGTVTWQVTIAGDGTDVTNALYSNWSTTANTFFNNSGNITNGQTNWNITFDTSTLTDAEDTTLTVNVSNATASTTSTLLINIDNTAPVCSFSVDRDVVFANDQLGVIVTDASTDTTDITYNYTLYRGDNTISTSTTSQNPTFSLSDFDQPDEFTLSSVIKDEALASTACTNQSILVQGSDTDSGDDAQVGSSFLEKIVENKMTVIVSAGLFFILAIGSILFLVTNKGKSKR